MNKVVNEEALVRDINSAVREIIERHAFTAEHKIVVCATLTAASFEVLYVSYRFKGFTKRKAMQLCRKEVGGAITEPRTLRRLEEKYQEALLIKTIKELS